MYMNLGQNNSLSKEINVFLTRKANTDYTDTAL